VNVVPVALTGDGPTGVRFSSCRLGCPTRPACISCAKIRPFCSWTPSVTARHRPLDAAGIRETIEDYASAARNAIAAGFDGVEVHAAYGFLPHQFLSTNANQRDDEWGGSVQGRIRFTVETAKAVAQAIDADRVGVRISPVSGYQDIVEDNHRDTYLALLDALGPIGLAYLHIAEGIDTEFTDHLRERWNERSSSIRTPRADTPDRRR
jgi:N-ethylmaleimide reductase